jgi:hypothetical protein
MRPQRVFSAANFSRISTLCLCQTLGLDQYEVKVVLFITVFLLAMWEVLELLASVLMLFLKTGTRSAQLSFGKQDT